MGDDLPPDLGVRADHAARVCALARAGDRFPLLAGGARVAGGAALTFELRVGADRASAAAAAGRVCRLLGADGAWLALDLALDPAPGTDLGAILVAVVSGESLWSEVRPGLDGAGNRSSVLMGAERLPVRGWSPSHLAVSTGVSRASSSTARACPARR